MSETNPEQRRRQASSSFSGILLILVIVMLGVALHAYYDMHISTTGSQATAEGQA